MDIIINQIFIIQISIINLEKKINTPYIIEKKYPIYATEFILKEIDIDKMHIFNHFDFGSYLEFKGIPAFIDSRSGVFSREFNDTSILEDWYKSINGETDYKEIFKKYNITHALLYKDELISQYIDDDTNYNMIYEDDYFVLYEKKKNDSIPLKSIFNQKTQKL